MEKGEVEIKSATVSVGRIVMNAIRKYEGSNGISLPKLKKILQEEKKLDIVQHDSEIKLALKKAMDRGILAREGGSYKVIFIIFTFRYAFYFYTFRSFNPIKN